MRVCWGHPILVRWSRPGSGAKRPSAPEGPAGSGCPVRAGVRGRLRRLRTAILLCAAAFSLSAQAVAPLARQYRESPTPARRAALLRLASQYPSHLNGALALLAVGVSEVESGEYAAAAGHLEKAESRLAEIPDYVNYYLGLAYSGLSRNEAAARRLESVAGAAPSGPLAGKAAAALGKALLAAGTPDKAVSVLLARYQQLPQPEGDLSLAYAYEAAGSLVDAAARGQRVYYSYPESREAEAAADLLARLRAKLGADYPPPLPADMLRRAARWVDSGNYQRARKEYEALARELGGAERELAQVRSGAAQYLSGAAGPAQRYLDALRPVSSEADAERLYYLVQCARRLEKFDELRDYTGQLRSRHPDSAWLTKALVWAGNYYLLKNESTSYVPLFRECYERFPSSPQAEYCHWKVAWHAYITRSGEAGGLLSDYLRRFPSGEKAAAAIYFQGRLAEEAGAGAEAHYRRVIERFPGSYYYQLAEERLGKPPASVAERVNFEPGPEERLRIRRARLLYDAGLAALGDGELRQAARGNPSAHILAMELARQAAQRDSPDQAVRHIKGAFPQYLSVPLEAAPPEFWRLAFPLSYRTSLQRYSKTHGIELNLLAGLIRQESEFGVRAVSRAGARGLMQVLPATGRQLASRLKLKGYSAASLFTADMNIRLGSYYLRGLLDAYGGRLEPALAAYNGGKARVDEWLTWAAFREPAEFIETIPITETRGYVQAVLRNSWAYGRIYLGEPVRPQGVSSARE